MEIKLEGDGNRFRKKAGKKRKRCSNNDMKTAKKLARKRLVKGLEKGLIEG